MWMVKIVAVWMRVPAPVIAVMAEYSNNQIHLNTGMFSVPGQRTNPKYVSSYVLLQLFDQKKKAMQLFGRR
jgi:hypothetical protein